MNQGIFPLLDEDGDVLDRTLSDSLGVFVLDARLGSLHLEAERIGYRTTRSLLFEIQRLDTLEVEFRIDAEAVLLAPNIVTASDRPGEELFDERQAMGEGFFYKPALIDSIRPEKYVAEIFRAQDRRTRLPWMVAELFPERGVLGRGGVDPEQVDAAFLAAPNLEARFAGIVGREYQGLLNQERVYAYSITDVSTEILEASLELLMTLREYEREIG